MTQQKKAALAAVPKIEEGTPLTQEQQQVQALSQQLQTTRTELAVLKQMYAEVSVQARVALAEREQLVAQVQRDRQTIEKLVADAQKVEASAAEETAKEAEREG